MAKRDPFACDPVHQEIWAGQLVELKDGRKMCSACWDRFQLAHRTTWRSYVKPRPAEERERLVDEIMARADGR